MNSDMEMLAAVRAQNEFTQFSLVRVRKSFSEKVNLHWKNLFLPLFLTIEKNWKEHFKVRLDTKK